MMETHSAKRAIKQELGLKPLNRNRWLQTQEYEIFFYVYLKSFPQPPKASHIQMDSIGREDAFNYVLSSK